MKLFVSFAKLYVFTLLLTFCTIGFNCIAQNKCHTRTDSISLEQFDDGIHHWNLFNPQRNYSRYQPHQISEIALNLVGYQNADGGWPKNLDVLARLRTDSVKKTLTERNRESTFDNNNVFPQIEYLSKAYCLTGDVRFKKSAEKGFDYIFTTQRPTGGWRGWDVDGITFNDQIMTGIMHLLLDVEQGKDYYTWISENYRKKITQSLKRAITATLKCQIETNGEKTAWCQQHDHQTFLPIKARSYELPSITARESSDVLVFLLRLEQPNDSVKNAVHAAVKWLQKSALKGIRLDKVAIKEEEAHLINKEYKTDLVIVKDSLAEPIWARFYDLETNRPFLCRRSGEIVYHLHEVEPERRTGYAWYGYWPKEILNNSYPKWKEKINK